MNNQERIEVVIVGPQGIGKSNLAKYLKKEITKFSNENNVDITVGTIQSLNNMANLEYEVETK